MALRRLKAGTVRTERPFHWCTSASLLQRVPQPLGRPLAAVERPPYWPGWGMGWIREELMSDSGLQRNGHRANADRMYPLHTFFPQIFQQI